MIYLNTNSNGMNTEGIGAMVQFQLFCYSLSQILKVGYCFSNFSNFTHYQYNNLTQEEFMNDINRFFNFPNNIEEFKFPKIKINDENISFINSLIDQNLIVEISPHVLMSLGQKSIDMIENQRYIKNLKKNIFLDDNLKYKTYNKEEKNIAIHIRVFTKTDCDTSLSREYFDISKKEYYQNVIKTLSKKFKKEKLCIRIYSQGDENNFSFFNSLKNEIPEYHKIELHIEEHPLTTLFYMIESDILVMANSSLSYIAHLYRDKETYVKKSFYHTVYNENTFFINDSGIII